MSDTPKTTSRTAQKAAISANTGPAPARGRGCKVGKGSATTPLGDEPIPLDDEDELQDKNIENTQTETKNIKGRKKPKVKLQNIKPSNQTQDWVRVLRKLCNPMWLVSKRIVLIYIKCHRFKK